MTRKMLAVSTAIASMIAFAPETGAGSAAEVPAAPPAPPVPAVAPVVSRERQNGFTRPVAGTKTGLIWDIADQISTREGRPAKRDEVFTAYKAAVPDAIQGTMSTQYSRWCGFHNVSEVLRKMRAEEKALAKAGEAEAKAKAEAEKAEKAAAKEAEKAERERVKAEKAAAREAEKAEKAAAKKAEKEAAAAAAAAAAAQ